VGVRRREDVIIAGGPDVERRQKVNTHDERGDQPAHDYDRERPLRVRTIPRDRAAGSKPTLATSILIMMGRSRS
jgi:hypothetical protein